MMQNQKKTTIVVPIYNSYQEVKKLVDNCLVSLTDYTVLLIDDSSTCQLTVNYLEEVVNRFKHIHLQRNETNLGFVKSANRGMKEADPSDVILLNSDTLPAGKWLEKLMTAAYQSDTVATVSPLSNSAGFFSVPKSNSVNELSSHVDLENLAYLLEVAVKKLGVSTIETSPVSGGFCQYIRREVLNSIGYFDEFLFFRGYGEETDFCMRASQAGFQHYIALDAFVYHSRGASFGLEKEALKRKNSAVLKSLFPDFIPVLKTYEKKSVIPRIGNQLEELMNRKFFKDNCVC